MVNSRKPSFSFLVLSYNHEKYILEHLVSIKYLVENYGKDIDVDLIINDDGSKDNTKYLVEKWIAQHRSLFRSVHFIFNEKNIGTCASVNNMLSYMHADVCKITAGDDVYSYENIFYLAKNSPSHAMISGRVLHLMDSTISYNAFENKLLYATQVIYKNDSLLHRFKHFSYNNAPNMIYMADCLKDITVREFLSRFDVTEDWPLQIGISKQFPNRALSLLDNVLVYYRRTLGSTYIVANKRFIKDKFDIYNDLIDGENDWLERIRLKNRKFCFATNNKYINKFFNIDFYFFLASCIFHFFTIVNDDAEKKISVSKHQSHYNFIKNEASRIKSTFLS